MSPLVRGLPPASVLTVMTTVTLSSLHRHAPPPHCHGVAVHDGQNGRGDGAISVPGGSPDLRKKRKRPYPWFSPSDRPRDRKSAPTLLKGPGAARRHPVRAPDHLSGHPSGICPGSVRRAWSSVPRTDPGRIPDGPQTDPRTDPGGPLSGVGVPRGGTLPRGTREVAHGRAGSALPVPSRESGPPGLRGEAPGRTPTTSLAAVYANLRDEQFTIGDSALETFTDCRSSDTGSELRRFND